MIRTAHIQLRCEPLLAEQFALAAALRQRTASAVLRELMSLYVEQATDSKNDETASPGGLACDTQLTDTTATPTESGARAA